MKIKNKKLKANGRSFGNINDVISLMQFVLKSIHYVKYENKKIEEIFNYLNKKAYKASFSMDNGKDFYFYRICFI